MRRRDFLIGIGVATFSVCSAEAAVDAIASIERRYRARIGLAAFDARGHLVISHRAQERFPLASTQKLPLVMTALAQVDAGRESLARRVQITEAELEHSYSTIADRYPHGVTLPLNEICALTISDSDNTAADVLTGIVGGPHVVTAYLRSLGVRDVRIDRLERELPSYATVAEARDTGTPNAMAQLALRLITKSPLSPASTRQLLEWMHATRTGDARFRAGVPLGWRVADKTGTYRNAANDVGILYPPSHRPIAVACYVHPVATTDDGSRAIAAATRVLVAHGSNWGKSIATFTPFGKLKL
jgi:beta-lactamase class A